MSLRIIFLGTAGSVPTPKRSLPSIVIQRKNELLFFDCGEGVQRQMIKTGVGFHRKTKILISHMHGDHVLGLPGLIQTMSLYDRRKKLEVYGPIGIKAFLEAVLATLHFSLTFQIEITEIAEPGEVCDEKEYTTQVVQTDHVIPNFAYALVEKPRPGKFDPQKARALGVPEGPLWSKLQYGKHVQLPRNNIVRPEQVVSPPRRGRKIVYTGDTKPDARVVKLAENADLLIHDATFDDELIEKAEIDGHSTPRQAAEIAKKAKVKRLILTHISARYPNACPLQKQARLVFPNVHVAEDFMKIEVPLPNDWQ